jgi:hypothetical protein
MLHDNEQLKEQLFTQIAIFEQYLKVADLQEQARVKENEDD